MCRYLTTNELIYNQMEHLYSSCKNLKVFYVKLSLWMDQEAVFGVERLVSGGYSV